MRASKLVVLCTVLAAPLAAPSAARASLPWQRTVGADVDAAFSESIGEHTTEFEIDASHAGRAHNVELAASLLDGAVIEPGAILSFNERIGERTIEAGFAVAPELHDGHLHEGIGGGVCQVATTLHIAAIEGGLDIVEHRVHSIPSRYAPVGLDATVFYGRIDFRVRNPYSFAVRVRASTEDGVLVVGLEGAEAVAPRRIESRVVRTLEGGEHTIVDPSVAPGERIVDERGRDGMVVRVRAIGPDGTHSDRMVRYSRSPRVVRVGA